MPTKIYFVRHGETTANLINAWEGKKGNSPLTERGLEQARATAKYFKLLDIPFSTVYTSPPSRAYHTAQIISNELELPLKVDDSFNELDMGDFEGKTSKELLQQYPEIVAQWGKNLNLAPPNGETPMQVMARVSQRIQQLIHEHYGNNIIVISHQGAIAGGVAAFLNDPPKWIGYQLSNAGLLVLVQNNGNSFIEIVNATDHLKDIGTQQWAS